MESLMPPSEKYVCQSKACRREIEIEIPPPREAGKISNPRCTCGSEMKKPYSKPNIRIFAIPREGFQRKATG